MSKRNLRDGWEQAALRVTSAVAVCLLAAVAAGDQRITSSAGRGGAKIQSFIQKLRPYDPSAPELMRERPAGLVEWDLEDIESEIRSRIDVEKNRHELDVNYYRIGYTIAYPLSLASSPRMDDLPVGIRGITYPWYTWLSWALEERWRLLHASWRRFGDRESGALLQLELSALAGWDQFCESAGNASLSTAHIGGCLAQALSVREGWDADMYVKARSAAETMIEREVWPWFEREWPGGREVGARDLQNIRVIILARSAQLARVIGSSRAAALESRARDALRAWFRYRLGKPPYSEGSAYDGFLMDSLTEWLSGLSDRQALLAEGRDAFAGLAAEWIQMALPGRVDVAAPLGDVEPEMPFWMTALFRLAKWYRMPDGAWLVRRLPAACLPAALLAEALEHGGLPKNGVLPPEPGTCEHPYAVSLRTGWEGFDILAAIGLTRGDMGHLHTDAGQVVLGWQGRFWITDPGYQQYRPGAERDFSLGPEAHNFPVITGKAQTKRAPRLISLFRLPDGGQSAVIDLSACYEGLPAGGYVEREVRLLPGAAPLVIVRDRFAGVGRGADVRTPWQGGTHLAWAFRRGWARLSDGVHALWIGVFPGNIAAAALDRHEGSRGPLTLHDITALAEGSGDRYWVFVCDPAGAWEPPAQKCVDIIRDWDKAVGVR